MPGIGDLVTLLSVDNTAFKKGLSGATSSLTTFSSGVRGIVGPIAGFLAGVWGTSASISGAKEALANQRKLVTVLEATGGAAGLTAAEIAEYAGQLQKTTNFEDDATVGAAAMLASFTNIRGEMFFSTIDAAADLATVMGGDLTSATMLLGKAMNDPEAGIKKLAKAGVMLTDEQQKLVKSLQSSGDLIGAQGVLMDAVQSKFGGAAKNLADPWTQFKNVLGDVGENIGATLLPSINVLSDALSSMLGTVAGGGDWFKSMGIEVAVVLSNMGGLLTLGVAQWQLFFVELGNDAAHFFTEAIPTYLTWFADNWGNVLFTAADYAATIFINLGTNIRNLWQTVLDFFAGNGVKFNWTPLTEGAKSAIDKLPDVPKRLTTDFENGLKSDIAAMSEHLGESMNTQRAELEKKFSPLAKVPSFTAEDADAGDAKAAKAKKTDMKAALVGTSEAASILLRGTGPKSMEAIAKDQLGVAKQQLVATKANKPMEMFTINFGPG